MDGWCDEPGNQGLEDPGITVGESTAACRTGRVEERYDRWVPARIAIHGGKTSLQNHSGCHMNGIV